MTEIRKEVHEEIDRMPEEQVVGLKNILRQPDIVEQAERP